LSSIHDGNDRSTSMRASTSSIPTTITPEGNGTHG
jgi:hypothetical protein